jgi:SAM-dependent methyltransferase
VTRSLAPPLPATRRVGKGARIEALETHGGAHRARLKALVLTSLERARLLRPAYRTYERLRALGNRDGVAIPTDSLPLPPAKLRGRVAGTANATWFLESGRLASDTIQSSLAGAGLRLEDLGAVLDFGCGCGRVLRWLRDIPAELRGADFDGDAIAWCRKNLSFAKFERNRLAPPLSYEPESFDLIYVFSVLTHLPVKLQHDWMREFGRLLRCGGFLLVSTHGEPYVSRLTPAERDSFARGEVVVRFDQVAGTNLCAAFHPRTYVEEGLADGLEVIQWEPEGANGNPHQDLFLFRKPLVSDSA